jgi:hypothetical protein
MSYPVVDIANSTEFIVSGKVSYKSLLCKNDDYNVTPKTHWTAKSRGVCLVTRITAIVKTPNGNIEAKPYKSSGTSYSQFAVIALSPTEFQVTRRV